MKYAMLGLLLGMALLGCAGFSYRYYGLGDVDYTKGTLLGDKPENDLPFATCEPSVSSKHPCVVLKADEFFRFKQDYQDTQNKLKECESRDSR